MCDLFLRHFAVFAVCRPETSGTCHRIWRVSGVALITLARRYYKDCASAVARVFFVRDIQATGMWLWFSSFSVLESPCRIGHALELADVSDERLGISAVEVFWCCRRVTYLRQG